MKKGMRDESLHCLCKSTQNNTQILTKSRSVFSVCRVFIFESIQYNLQMYFYQTRSVKF
jgi:hypothetical protein